MEKNILQLDPEKEKKRIVGFLKEIFERQGIKKAVIGLSGGVDSTVSFYLLKEFLKPSDIVIAHLYYEKPVFEQMEKVLKTAKIPRGNMHVLSIKKPVDDVASLLMIDSSEENKVRIGNVVARMRMVALFDLAKEHMALVCGTENKSEHLLGYFTRFGDQASDVEPIEHLYKTQIFGLARCLGIPEAIIQQHPTAGLWAGQTDEGEMGFTYAEADQVLFFYFDKRLSIEEIEEKGFTKAKQVLARCKQNHFKHETPYHL